MTSLPARQPSSPGRLPARTLPGPPSSILSPQGWFLRLTQGVLRRGHPERLQRERDRGLSDVEIGERLVSQAAIQAAIVGGLAGLGATASEIASIPTFGASLALWAGVSGGELSYLSYAQLRLVQDLAYLHDIPVDPQNPQDVLTILGVAQGLKPTELVAATFTRAAETATAGALQEYTARVVARLVQRLARSIGWELLERTVIKYAVPVFSIFAGAAINYASVRSLGRIANAYFRQLRVRNRVFQVLAAETRFQAAFPALALHTARVGGMRRDQHRLYEMLRAALGDALRPDAERAGLLDADQPTLDETLRQVDDPRTRRALMDTAVLMTLADVTLADEEKRYLVHVSEVLNVPLDLVQVEQAFRDLHPRGLSAGLAAVSKWGCLILGILGTVLFLCWLALLLFYVQAGALFVYSLFVLSSR